MFNKFSRLRNSKTQRYDNSVKQSDETKIIKRFVVNFLYVLYIDLTFSQLRMMFNSKNYEKHIKTGRVSADELYCPGNVWFNGSIKSHLKLGRELLVSHGNETDPSITFNDDPLTGLYLAGTGAVGITGGAETIATFSNIGFQLNKPLTTRNGDNIVLNPSGPYIDCTGHTLINVEGITGDGGTTNPNRYQVISQNSVITTDDTPTILYAISTVNNAGYTFNTDITCVCVSDGESTGGIVFPSKGKNINGIASVPNKYNKSIAIDDPLFGIDVYLEAEGNIINVIVEGLPSKTIKWFGATQVTRQLF